MNNNGRYSTNMYQDNNFHIKVNRNSIPYNVKANQILSNSLIQMNDQNYYGIDKRINRLKKEELLLKKINKNKNKVLSLNNSNNLSSLINKQKFNKINNSEKIVQKYKSEKGIIETLNKIRNNHRKFNYSNKINKPNSNRTSLNNNITHNQNSININDYRTKINNNKNKLKKTLFKASSFNNDLKNSIKNISLKNYNINFNRNNNINLNKNNNNLIIDDTTSNDTDLLTESANLNKETNLYVYRSEVQYPVKNVISNLNLQNNKYKDIFNYNYKPNTEKTLNSNFNDDNKNKKNSNLNLLENISKSVGNSKTKRQIYSNSGEPSYESNFLSPLQSKILSNKRSNIKTFNNQNFLNSDNNSIKINNKFQNLQERFSPILFNYKDRKNNKFYNIEDLGIENNLIDKSNNNNAKSCHHFYRKKCFSKEKYENTNYYKDFFDEESQSREKTVYIHNNKNNIFLNDEDYNIDNYKYYNRNRNRRMRIQLKFISLFCDSVEKFLIFILKYYFKYFISQLKKFIDFKKNNNYKKYYNSENKIKNKNIHNLLSRRIKNKNNPKKLYYLDKDRFPINLSNYKKYNNNNDNKIYSFKIISRNENSDDIYKKKSNSINKSLNHLINKNRDEIMYNRINKKKNLSFHKVYIPKHKNPQYNKYKTLKINTNTFMSDLNINNNKDYINNTINNSINIYTQNNTQSRKNYHTINVNDNIISKINHITTLKRKYINNKKMNNSLRINTNNTNDNLNIYTKKVQITTNNIYSKPLFKKIRSKLLEKEKMENKNLNSSQNFVSIENNNINNMNGLLINNNDSKPSKINQNKNENKIFNSDKKNEINKINNNNLLCKKIVSRKKTNSTNDNNILKMQLNENKNNEIIIENNNNELKIIQKEENNDKMNNIIKDILENKENEKEIENNKCTIIRSIIVKDVSSKDKLLNVYVKYYEYKFNISNNKFSHPLTIISNESINLLSIITNNHSKKNNNKYLHQILSSIIEEDEKSKANPSLNNSVISEEDTEKNNTNTNNHMNNIFTKNIVIYLTNILQNLLDDNKKTILYIFMRNLKKIQNKLYLQNSLIQYNSMIKNCSKDNSNNAIDEYNDENQLITCNGGNEVELNKMSKIEEKNNNSSNNIFFYTADNSLLEDKLNNKKNILIGSLLFKDFEIKDEEYDIIKPKKYFSSSSINQIKNNGTEKNLINKNILRNLMVEIDNKKVEKYFHFWKKTIKNNINYEINGSIDNGMNISKRNLEQNKLSNILNNNDFKGINEIQFLDIDKESEENENKEIKNKNSFEDFEKNIIKFRNILIKLALKK